MEGVQEMMTRVRLGILLSFIGFVALECLGIGTGFYHYLNGFPHALGSWFSVVTGTVANPNKVNAVDTISSGGQVPPFSIGSFTWSIPWEFRVGNGSPKVFTTVTHLQEADANGTVTISKGGTTKTKNADDPDSGF